MRGFTMNDADMNGFYRKIIRMFMNRYTKSAAKGRASFFLLFGIHMVTALALLTVYTSRAASATINALKTIRANKVVAMPAVVKATRIARALVTAVVVITASMVVPAFTPSVTASELVTDILLRIEVPAGAEYVVVDVMDGVEARYRTMAYGDIYGTYSCAGYAKAYYSAVYGVNIQNLLDTGPPHPEDLFVQVETPQKGDLIFYPSPPNRNNHSAIVKSFDGTRIVLIEQNFKWAQANGTYTTVNRTIPYPPDQNERYEIWRLVFVQDESEYNTIAMPNPENAKPGLPGLPDSTDPQDTDLTDNSVTGVGSNDADLSDSELSDTGLSETEQDIAPGTSSGVHSGTEPGSQSDIESDMEPETAPVFQTEHGDLLYESIVTIGRYAMQVNGVDMPIDAPALIENDRTVMPVRWVSYALGLDEDDLVWDVPSRTVTVFNGDDIIWFTVDSNYLYVNGVPILMDCPATIKMERAYLPIKYLAEALTVSYYWEPETASATFFRYANTYS